MPGMQRIAMLPRMSVRYYEPPTPSHVSLSKLIGKWYFRPLWWALQKLGAEYQERIPESYPIQEYTIDESSIPKMISTSQRAMRYLWDKEATTLIVGRDEMAKLMRDEPAEYLQFNMQMPLGYGAQFRYMGLRVVCVPWLEGWALLPELDK